MNDRRPNQDQPTTKPSFLGLLTGIAVAEHHAHNYLTAWADVTEDRDVADVLRFVAVREIEHFHAFRKRLVELGYDVRFPEATDEDARDLEVAHSSMSDAEKWEHFELDVQEDRDVFDGMFADKTIDPITGALLGRYIAEERDSVRRFASCRARASDAASA